MDGLRGIAILLVVFYHNYKFTGHFVFGWLGVDLFFVLSGFLITNILLNTVHQPGFLKNFYTRRVFRIFPLYYLTLIAFFVLFPLLGWFGQYTGYDLRHQLWYWLFLQNWLLSVNFPAGLSILNHLWSLAVEEQFYLFWPLLVLWIRRPVRLAYIMLLILLAVIVIRIWLFFSHIQTLNHDTLYTFTRVDGLCIGSMVALLHRINRPFLSNHMAIIVTSLATLNFLFYFLTRNEPGGYPYYAFIGYTTFTAMFGLLVHELVSSPGTWLSRAISWTPLRFLGKISYAFYVFHWPIFIMLTPVIQSRLASSLPASGSNFVSSTIATLVAFILSIISYYTFELKFLKMKERFA